MRCLSEIQKSSELGFQSFGGRSFRGLVTALEADLALTKTEVAFPDGQGLLGDFPIQVESPLLEALGTLHCQLGTSQVHPDMVGSEPGGLHAEGILQFRNSPHGDGYQEVSVSEAEEIELDLGQGAGPGCMALEVERCQASLRQAHLRMLDPDGVQVLVRSQEGPHIGLDLHAADGEQVVAQPDVFQHQGAQGGVEFHVPDGKGQSRFLPHQPIEPSRHPLQGRRPIEQPWAQGECGGAGHDSVGDPTHPPSAPELPNRFLGGVPHG